MRLAKDDLNESRPQTLTNWRTMLLPQLMSALHGTVKCQAALLREDESLAGEPFEWARCGRCQSTAAFLSHRTIA